MTQVLRTVSGTLVVRTCYYFHYYHVIVTRMGLGISYHSQGDRLVNTQVNREQDWDGSSIENRCPPQAVEFWEVFLEEGMRG